jgi:hypothetical protein
LPNYSAELSGKVWHSAPDNNGRFAHFLKLESRQTAIIVCSGLPHPTQQVQFLKMCAKQMAILI